MENPIIEFPVLKEIGKILKKLNNKSKNKSNTLEEIGKIFKKIFVNKPKLLEELFIRKKQENSDFPQNEIYRRGVFDNSLLMECLARDGGDYVFKKSQFEIIYKSLKPYYKDNDDINRQDILNIAGKNTLLTLAIKKGYYEVALDMLGHFQNLDVNKADYQGNTALHLACFLYGCNPKETKLLEDLIHKLIERDASLTKENNLAKTSGEFSEYCTPYKLLTTNFDDINLLEKVKFEVLGEDKQKEISVLIKEEESSIERYKKYAEENKYFSIFEMRGHLKDDYYKNFKSWGSQINHKDEYSFIKDLATEQIFPFSPSHKDTPYSFERDITHHRKMKGDIYKNKEETLSKQTSQDFLKEIEKKYKEQKRLNNDHKETYRTDYSKKGQKEGRQKLESIRTEDYSSLRTKY